MAEEAGMMLVALVRGEDFDVFTHGERLTEGKARDVA
jgi:FdhD protein